jgi:hypothetical protein
MEHARNILMSYRIVLSACLISSLSTGQLLAAEFGLDVFADGDSTYYEYISDGFVRMDLYSPLQPKNQSIHAISNPSTIYNQNFDGFPHDRILRLGKVTYDDSGVSGGTGSAPITAVTLGIAKDPLDSTYTNWNRFNTNTLVSEPSGGYGTVNLVDGLPVGISLAADVTLEVVTPFGSTENGYYPGTFTIDAANNRFSFEAEGHQIMDIIFGNDLDMHLRWDFAGVLLGFPPDSASIADYDRNGTVDDTDRLLWQNTYAATSHVAGDGNLDDEIDAADYVVWRKLDDGLGESPATAHVPEPATIVIVTLAAAYSLVAIRRRHA